MLRARSHSKPTSFYLDVNVQKMQVCRSLSGEPLSIVRAHVLAAMRKIPYKVYVGLEDYVKIAGAYCECVAG